MKNKQYYISSKNGFTFVELAISITILTILSVLGFISYGKNLEDSRDTQRESDLLYIENALKLHKTNRGNYPSPGENFNIVNSGTLSAIQGKMNESVIISTLQNIPLDPYVKIPYIYSIGRNSQEFQLAATLENNGVNKALLKGDFKVVSKNILPTIILALHGSGDVEINEFIGLGSSNRKKFIFDNGPDNLPYTFTFPFLPYSIDTSFTGLLDNPRIVWSQNNDYKNCNEILNANKNIGTGEYQVNNYGTLENITCPSTHTPKNCKEIIETYPLSTSGIYTIMPEGASRFFTSYCDMSTASGGWTLVAKDGTDFNYTIGHCNFMNPPNNILKENSFIYWACDLNQTEMLFWTPTGWVVGTSNEKDDCGIRSTKVNNNNCSWTGSTSKTFDIKQVGGCMSGSINPSGWWLWWKGGDWETTVSKNLSGLSTTLSGSCNDATGLASTSYCNLFDIYDDTGNGIGQGWGYRGASCVGGYTDRSTSPIDETHLIFVR